MRRVQFYINDTYWASFDLDSIPRKGEKWEIGKESYRIKDVVWRMNDASSDYVYPIIYLE